MISKDVLISQLNDLFAPDSIAIVGLPREMKTGKLFLLSLLDQDYKGKIYPVNPNTEEIDGLKSYPRLMDIPGKIDLVIFLYQTMLHFPF